MTHEEQMVSQGTFPLDSHVLILICSWWYFPSSSDWDVLPLRLFDCKDEVLKDQEAYLQDTNGATPEYLIVSQVWGEANKTISLPSVKWTMPISDESKWNDILSYCKREKIRWLWMDILCINQSQSDEANQEKSKEIPKMGQYYRQARNCLVVPDDYANFSVAHSNIMNIYYTTIKPQLPITKENSLRIWNSIAMVDAVISNKWFWRMWTLQELLLPEKHILLDGQPLIVDRLRDIVAWYRTVLSDGTLTKPYNGTNYDYIHPGYEVVVTKNWEADKMGWNLMKDLKENGYVDLVSAVYGSRDKSCKVYVDRLLGLYGLLKQSDMVENPETNDDMSHPWDSLRALWKEMVSRAILSNKVWPLLHDLYPPEEVPVGDRWIPQITTLLSVPVTFENYPETLNHQNQGRMAIMPGGLELSVRVVGQVIGASQSIGDGGGERNKLFIWTWALTMHGLNTKPIIQQFKDGIARTSGTVSPEKVTQWHEALDRALSAPTLQECLQIYEEAYLRLQLLTAWDIRGWDRTILVVQIASQTPMVCLAWCHREDRPQVASRKCWIFDVTTDPVSDVKRWVVANQLEKNVFRKIGTVQSHPELIEEDHPLVAANVTFE